MRHSRKIYAQIRLILGSSFSLLTTTFLNIRLPYRCFGRAAPVASPRERDTLAAPINISRSTNILRGHHAGDAYARETSGVEAHGKGDSPPSPINDLFTISFLKPKSSHRLGRRRAIEFTPVAYSSSPHPQYKYSTLSPSGLGKLAARISRLRMNQAEYEAVQRA